MSKVGPTTGMFCAIVRPRPASRFSTSFTTPERSSSTLEPFTTSAPTPLGRVPVRM